MPWINPKHSSDWIKGGNNPVKYNWILFAQGFKTSVNAILENFEKSKKVENWIRIK